MLASPSLTVSKGRGATTKCVRRGTVSQKKGEFFYHSPCPFLGGEGGIFFGFFKRFWKPKEGLYFSKISESKVALRNNPKLKINKPSLLVFPHANIHIFICPKGSTFMLTFKMSKHL